jgi:zinc transporter ZupT
MYSVLLRAAIATLAAWAGAAFGIALGSNTARRRLDSLIYAAAGALLAITLCDVLPEAKESLGWPAFLASTASGCLLFYLLGRYVHPICPACSLGAFDEAADHRVGRTAALFLVAFGVHSLTDGVAVVVSDAMTGRADLSLLLALSLHKVPEGLALVLVLLGAGFSRRQAFGRTLAIEATTEVGALLGVLLLRGLPIPYLAILFAHIGGGFLYLVVNAASALSGGHGEQHGRRLPLAIGGISFSVTAALLRAIGHLAGHLTVHLAR